VKNPWVGILAGWFRFMHQRPIGVSVQPRGPTGCMRERSQVGTDYVEIEVSYRLP
jgi:hypothetical protein